MTTPPPQTTRKTIDTVISVERGHWVGDGFPVRNMFAQYNFTNRISPFLMMDYGGPTEFEPTSARRGVGQHPHKGFETVTLVMQGGVEHADSVGNRGEIGPGDVQWMTAGRGIVHEEFHSSAYAAAGGPFEMLQLWVNLPAEHKLVDPGYQALLDRDIPQVAIGDAGSVRVVAGAFDGVTGAARTHTPMNVWNLNLPTATRTELSIPETHNTLLFVMSGGLKVNDGQVLSAGELAVFELGGDTIDVSALADTSAVLLSGEPLDEPIAARGPFVMNTAEELRQAMLEYQSGQMGRVSV